MSDGGEWRVKRREGEGKRMRGREGGERGRMRVMRVMVSISENSHQSSVISH